MIISKKLTQITYSGQDISLSTSSIKNYVVTIYSVNSSGLGYLSFSSSSAFNSLLSLQSGKTYLIESVTENLPWELPSCMDGIVTTTSGPTTSTTGVPTTTSGPNESNSGSGNGSGSFSGSGSGSFCTDCTFQEINNLETYTAYGFDIFLEDYFDKTQPIRVYSGTNGTTLTVPSGCDYAMSIPIDGGFLKDQSVTPGEVLIFNSKIILGQRKVGGIVACFGGGKRARKIEWNGMWARAAGDLNLTTCDSKSPGADVLLSQWGPNLSAGGALSVRKSLFPLGVTGMLAKADAWYWSAPCWNGVMDPDGDLAQTFSAIYLRTNLYYRDTNSSPFTIVMRKTWFAKAYGNGAVNFDVQKACTWDPPYNDYTTCSCFREIEAERSLPIYRMGCEWVTAYPDIVYLDTLSQEHKDLVQPWIESEPKYGYVGCFNLL